ncbi:MAG: hypothetical protein IKD88_10000 [Lachnospiraceae bacterium]|nr:hypothetical protein [Lachnospiraceae bacterium]
MKGRRFPTIGTWIGAVRALPDLCAYRVVCGMIPELTGYRAGTVLFLREKAAERGYVNLRTYARVLRKDPAEIAWLSTRLTYKGTHFFRGEDWGFFIGRCLSELADRSEVRVWCAGCSLGQEAYSVLTALLDYVPLEKIRILATDYNDELLEKCRSGRYLNMHLHEIPERLRRYVETGEKTFTFLPELRAAVETKPLNLITDDYPAPFDVILCRNVIKFFSGDMIPRVQRRLAASLAPGGFLFLSADDDRRGVKDRVEMIPRPEELGLQQLENRCIYRKHA